MSGELVQVSGTASNPGDVVYFYYLNGGTYTLLGSTDSVTTAASVATGNTTAGSYNATIYLPATDTGGTIVAIDGTTGASVPVTATVVNPVGATGATGATG